MQSGNVVLDKSYDSVKEGRVTTRFDPDMKGTLWVNMSRDTERQNFSLPLLNGLKTLLHGVRGDEVMWRHNGKPTPIKYAVLKSEHPDYFNLGGDLRHFRTCIDKADWKGLHDYSRLCLDIFYDWATVFSGRATTISLVQGRALGGGFETALAADFVIAEEHSEFGFPEIMFGLFPCTGGMSLLCRRISSHQAERMMTNGRIYSAMELKEMGVIDEICEKGSGAEAVEKFISRHAKHLMARLMVQRSRSRATPLNYEELLTVVDEWVETAKQLSADDLRVMEMLALMQAGR